MMNVCCTYVRVLYVAVDVAHNAFAFSCTLFGYLTIDSFVNMSSLIAASIWRCHIITCVEFMRLCLCISATVCFFLTVCALCVHMCVRAHSIYVVLCKPIMKNTHIKGDTESERASADRAH